MATRETFTVKTALIVFEDGCVDWPDTWGRWDTDAESATDEEVLRAARKHASQYDEAVLAIHVVEIEVPVPQPMPTLRPKSVREVMR